MNVKIQQLKLMRVAYLRHVGPYGEVGATWDRLLSIMGEDGYLGGSTMLLGICHDDPEVTPTAKIRYDACVTVGDESRSASACSRREQVVGECDGRRCRSNGWSAPRTAHRCGG